MIDDNYLILELFTKNGCLKLKYRNQERFPEIYNYINNRYQDSQSFSETLYRIKYHIEIRPVCLFCGNPAKFINIRQGFYDSCCLKQCILKKRNYTNLLKYGFINPLMNTDILEKTKVTNLQKYGVYYSAQSLIVKDKIKTIRNNYSELLMRLIIQKRLNTATLNNSYYIAARKRELTKLDRYGNQNYVNYDKAKLTNIQKYGVDNPAKNKVIKAKIWDTNLNRYGFKTPLLVEKIKALSYSLQSMFKKYHTHKLNHSFNTSKIEQQFKQYLEENYNNDFEYQYKSELYPFNCDFYIKSLNLYIEIQGSWTHGGHPFDKDSLDDINKLNTWKNKHNKFYDNAIKVWTISDVEKRNIAKINKLNYLEIFSTNIDICILQLNTYISKMNH